MKKIFTSPFFAVGAFVLAAILLLFSGIGGARAALTEISDTYDLTIETQEIDVQLLENGTDVGNVPETITLTFPNMPEKFEVGTKYDEVLTVANREDPDSNDNLDNNINEYVRVIVYKYWEDAEGNKIDSSLLSPDLIELNFVTNETSGNRWVIDEQASGGERTVLYYMDPLAPGATTYPFTDTISISSDMLENSTTTTTQTVDKDNNIFTTTTTTTLKDDLQGARFVVEVEVDAIQTHNFDEAMTGVWGTMGHDYVTFTPDSSIATLDNTNS